MSTLRNSVGIRAANDQIDYNAYVVQLELNVMEIQQNVNYLGLRHDIYNRADSGGSRISIWVAAFRPFTPPSLPPSV